MITTPIPLIQSTTPDLFIEWAVTPSTSTSDFYLDDTPCSPDSMDDCDFDSLSSDDDDTPTMELLASLQQADEDILLYHRGYEIIDKICDSLQGEVFHASNLNATDDESRYVAIKKTDKMLFEKNIAIQDGISFCVTENIVKEAAILKYLTADHAPLISDYIVRYIDFFESPDSYYLVTEYIASETDLKQFISTAKQHIQNGKLDLQTYQKTMKVLLWQLFVTVQWLHLSMKCSHLDLCLENILLKHANFIETKDGIVIDKAISIKLSDFGVSEVFKKDYLCCKQPLSLENAAYSSPTVFDEHLYDAQCEDNWRLGCLLFECMTVGERIYEPLDMDVFGGGYWALEHSQLKRYLGLKGLLNYFNVHSLSMLTELLNFSEHNRLKGMRVLTHEWFNKYFKRDEPQIIETFYNSGCKKGFYNMDLY